MKFLSQVYTSVSGSVGGITYFNGRFGHMVARSRTIPTQPGSTPQTQMRTAWSNAQALWVLADSLIRQRWDQHAATVVYQGPAGSYTINGRERFLAVLSLASYMNTVLLTTIPVTNEPPRDAGWLLLSEVAAQLPTLPDIGFDITVGNPNNHDIEVEIALSQPLPQTINFWKGPWDTQTLQNLAVPSETTGVLSFTDLEADRVYFVRIRGISATNEHRISEQFILRAVATIGVP